MEMTCSCLPSREAVIDGRRPSMGKPSDLPECSSNVFQDYSQPMAEPGRVLGPGRSCSEALLWLQSFSRTLHQPGFSYPISFPSLCPFPDVRPAPSPEGSPYLLLLSLPLLFVCISPNKSRRHLLLSYCLLLGGPELIQQELYPLYMSNF